MRILISTKPLDDSDGVEGEVLLEFDQQRNTIQIDLSVSKFKLDADELQEALAAFPIPRRGPRYFPYSMPRAMSSQQVRDDMLGAINTEAAVPQKKMASSDELEFLSLIQSLLMIGKNRETLTLHSSFYGEDGGKLEVVLLETGKTFIVRVEEVETNQSSDDDEDLA